MFSLNLFSIKKHDFTAISPIYVPCYRIYYTYFKSWRAHLSTGKMCYIFVVLSFVYFIKKVKTNLPRVTLVIFISELQYFDNTLLPLSREIFF